VGLEEAFGFSTTSSAVFPLSFLIEKSSPLSKEFLLVFLASFMMLAASFATRFEPLSRQVLDVWHAYFGGTLFYPSAASLRRTSTDSPRFFSSSFATIVNVTGIHPHFPTNRRNRGKSGHDDAPFQWLNGFFGGTPLGGVLLLLERVSCY
jgi:hypothetical protein